MRATMEGSEAERKVPKGLEDQAESNRSGASDMRLRSVTAPKCGEAGSEGAWTVARARGGPQGPDTSPSRRESNRTVCPFRSVTA